MVAESLPRDDEVLAVLGVWVTVGHHHDHREGEARVRSGDGQGRKKRARLGAVGLRPRGGVVHRITPHHITSHRIASHRIASHHTHPHYKTHTPHYITPPDEVDVAQNGISSRR